VERIQVVAGVNWTRIVEKESMKKMERENTVDTNTQFPKSQ
jgi:hypothetical protein